MLVTPRDWRANLVPPPICCFSCYKNILFLHMMPFRVQARLAHKWRFWAYSKCEARASQVKRAKAHEWATCFPCRVSHQVMSFWCELLQALPVNQSKYFSHLAKLINGLVMEEETTPTRPFVRVAVPENICLLCSKLVENPALRRKLFSSKRRPKLVKVYSFF